MVLLIITLFPPATKKNEFISEIAKSLPLRNIFPKIVTFRNSFSKQKYSTFSPIKATEANKETRKTCSRNWSKIWRI